MAAFLYPEWWYRPPAECGRRRGVATGAGVTEEGVASQREAGAELLDCWNKSSATGPIALTSVAAVAAVVRSIQASTALGKRPDGRTSALRDGGKDSGANPRVSRTTDGRRTYGRPG
ncbi:hypothetical protein GCM10010392_59310 [Streptomyces clavifer]|nr:hypothetical protein GCM10010392_59310 [Streptomyces clavifer]